MISESLSFLAAELNKFLDQKLGATTDARLILGNIAKVEDGDTGNTLNNKLILSLINVEVDKVTNVRENFNKTEPSVTHSNAPTVVNLYILIAANLSLYSDSLKNIAYVMQFFRAFNHFTPLTHPALDTRIAQINADLFTLDFEQINHIWSSLGGKSFPSVMYQVRQLTVEDENAIETQDDLIKTIVAEASIIAKSTSDIQ